MHDNPNQRYDHCSRPDLTHDTQLKTGFPEDLIIAISVVNCKLHPSLQRIWIEKCQKSDAKHRHGKGYSNPLWYIYIYIYIYCIIYINIHIIYTVLYCIDIVIYVYIQPNVTEESSMDLPFKCNPFCVEMLHGQRPNQAPALHKHEAHLKSNMDTKHYRTCRSSWVFSCCI